jgi:hypothetical protein
MAAYEIDSAHIALHFARQQLPERICLECGVRIGRLTTIEYAAIGGLCQGCDGGRQ